LRYQTNGKSPIRFGVFEFDRRTGELRKQGVRIRLCRHASQLLSFLLKTPGKIRTREELRQQLWSETTFVNFDQSINKAVHELREALGDWATRPRFIETIVGQGYRFIPVVQSRSASKMPVDARAGSVAVLPFIADDREPGGVFVSSQIAARLIDALSRMPRLRVLAYGTVKNVTLKDASPQQLGKQLGVRQVVVGELVWQNDDLLVHVELIDVADGAQMWGTQLQQRCPSLIECAAEMARQILQQLQPRLESLTLRAEPRARSCQSLPA
jgi:DNA-binding winged helix-turn-helix (wHTH) protein